MPIEDYALFKRRMLELKDHHWWGRQRTAEGRKVELQVLARIREEGALPVRAFEGRSGPMWGWKPAKRALEHLFAAGEVAIAAVKVSARLRAARARDPEALPRRADAVGPEFHRRYALRAVEGRGALTRPASPSTAVSAAGRRRCGRTSTRSSATGSSNASRWTTAARRLS